MRCNITATPRHRGDMRHGLRSTRQAEVIDGNQGMPIGTSVMLAVLDAMANVRGDGFSLADKDWDIVVKFDVFEV